MTKKSVLIVDDDEQVQRALKLYVSDLGYEATAAGDGAEALDTLERLSIEDRMPDLILMDTNMPGMSGFDVCRTIRERYGPSPMIIGMSTMDYMREWMLNGADYFFPKNAKNLDKIINEAFAQRTLTK